MFSAPPGALRTGDGRSGGPTPWLNLRTIFNMSWARAAIYPSQSTFLNPRSRDRAQPVQRSEGPLRDGPASEPLPLVFRSAISISGPQIDRVIHREADVSPFLSRRETIRLHRASLTIFLKGHILIGEVLFVESATAQRLPLGAHAVVTEKIEAALGYHVGFLDGVDGHVSRDILFLKQFPELTHVVASISRQRYRLGGQSPSRSGTTFHSP